MCLGGVSLFSVFSCLFTIFSCLFTIFQIKLTPPKHILALPIQGQKCIFSELQPKQISNFDLGHPVNYLVSLKHRVKNALFLSYNHFLLRNSEWNTLYKIQLIFWCQTPCSKPLGVTQNPKSTVILNNGTNWSHTRFPMSRL